MKPKHLDGRGKGEVSYDYKYDILIFKTKNRNYKQSFEFQNFVMDVDEENFITGIRIFDASKVFGFEKHALRDIVYWEFTANIENNVITVKFKFSCKMRNKLLVFPVRDNFTQQITERAPIKIANSSVGPISILT